MQVRSTQDLLRAPDAMGPPSAALSNGQRPNHGARSIRIRLRRTARSDGVTERACERRNGGAQWPPRRGAEAPQRGVWGANENVLRCDGSAQASDQRDLRQAQASHQRDLRQAQASQQRDLRQAQASQQRDLRPTLASHQRDQGPALPYQPNDRSRSAPWPPA